MAAAAVAAAVAVAVAMAVAVAVAAAVATTTNGDPCLGKSPNFDKFMTDAYICAGPKELILETFALALYDFL